MFYIITTPIFSMVRIKPKHRESRHISARALKLRQQELRIMRLVNEAKHNVQIEHAEGRRCFKMDRESSKHFQELIAQLKREGFTYMDIAKIVKPLFPEDVPLQNIQWVVMRRLRPKGNTTKGAQHREAFFHGRYKTIEEKHEEAFVKNQIFNLRMENPDIKIQEIAAKVGIPTPKVIEYLKELSESVDKQTTKEILSIKPKKRRKRINAFSAEEKWDIIQRNMGLIKKFVIGRVGRTPRDVEFDDLLSEVVVRLFSDLDYFDPKRGVKITTFLAHEAEGIASHIVREVAIRRRRKQEHLKKQKRRLF